MAVLNSKAAWFQWAGETPLASGGYLRLKQQYVAPTVFPDPNTTLDLEISQYAEHSSAAGKQNFAVQQAVLRRIPDLCPSNREPKLTKRLREWWKLDFKSFQAEIKKAFKADIPLKQRNEWERFLCEEGDKVRRLTAEIEQAERKIDALVYRLFDLTPGEITLLESSLKGQY